MRNCYGVYEINDIITDINRNFRLGEENITKGQENNHITTYVFT
jgi:hypothetical protein